MDGRKDVVVTVKKNLITIIVPLILLFPMLFTLPFMVAVLVIDKQIFSILPIIIASGIGFVGVYTLNMLIRFGNKKIVIYESGIEFCIWSLHFISWKEIQDITLKYALNTEVLIFILESGKRFELNLTDVQLNISSDEIYENILEIWIKVQT